MTIIANRKGKRFLPIFLPFALVRSLCIARKYDAILLGDGVLGVVGYALKLFYPHKPVIGIVHGLDLTYPSALYQKWWVRKFIPALDRLIAVGRETISAGTEKGIPKEKFTFIPNGVDTEKHFREHSRQELENILGESLADTQVLLTSGRLARRKGVAWFIRNVLPKLAENILYTVAGNGPDRANILLAIQEAGMEKRVKLLGYVDDATREILFNTCDLFIQPNIRVPGDMEGFGISVIEAASCQIPVIASKIEGLQDAISDGNNGFLIESENIEAYSHKIIELLKDTEYRRTFGKQARQYVIDHFRWEIIAQHYLDTIVQTIHTKKEKS